MINKHELIIFVVFLMLGLISIAYAADANNTSPKIENIDVGDITDTSAKITFEVNQSNADTIVRYGTTATSLNKNSGWNNDTGLERTITLSSLLKGKTYYFSIYAHNNTDNKKYRNSTIRNFTTTGDINTTGSTVPTIDNIYVGNITNNSAKITFEVNQSDADTLIRYGITEISFDKTSSWNNDTGLARTITLSSLLNQTKYYLSIYAYNNTDNKKYRNSTIRNFTTLSSVVNDTGDDPNKPGITSKSPSEKTVHTIIGENVTFNVTFDQTVNVTWYLDDIKTKNETLVSFSNYSNDTASIGNYNIT